MKHTLIFPLALFASASAHVGIILVANGVFDFYTLPSPGARVYTVELAVSGAGGVFHSLKTSDLEQKTERVEKEQNHVVLKSASKPMKPKSASVKSEQKSAPSPGKVSVIGAGGVSPAPDLGGSAFLGGGDAGIGAEVLYAPHPPYPVPAREEGVEGLTVLDVVIDATGQVTKVAVALSSGRDDLDSSAVKTIRQSWRFKPASVDGQAVASQQKIAVRYVLR